MKPCPRCHSISSWMTLSPIEEPKYSVVCLDCLLRGSSRETKEKAINKWNDVVRNVKRRGMFTATTDKGSNK
jgi:transcription elongation factor Elf1